MKDRSLLYFALGAVTVLSLGGVSAALTLRDDGIQFPDGSVQTTAVGARRSAYLTDAQVQGNFPLGSCTAGYHMASIWEIPDPTKLAYDSGATGALTGGDLGGGLAAGRNGWIRTGAISLDVIDNPGQANCLSWTGTTGFGTVVMGPAQWTNQTQVVFPFWKASTLACSSFARVWCVAD